MFSSHYSATQLLLGVFLIVLIVPTTWSVTSFDASLIGITNHDEEKRKELGSGTLTPVAAQKMLDEALVETKQTLKQQFCDEALGQNPCSTLPNDNIDFSKLFVYSFVTATAQNSFDIFSWQSFIGLNWPAVASDSATEISIGDQPEAPRVWSGYASLHTLFGKPTAHHLCDDIKPVDNMPTLITDKFVQAGGLPLIDKNLNYVIYDTRLNHELAEYIQLHKLDNLQGQLQFVSSGNEVDYPIGRYDNPKTKSGGSVGSIIIKTAWKLLDEKERGQPTRYYTMNGLIPVSTENSETGKGFCLQAKIGLIAMHIMRRTESGHGANWIWSTFEHVDNAPSAINARRPSDSLHEAKDLFPNGCQPAIDSDQSYGLYDVTCPHCKTNHVESRHWKWSKNWPHAVTAANKSADDRPIGSQVVRCWDIFSGTELINNIWREQLKDTVWSNYRSISAQWKGTNSGAMFPQGEVPRFLTNAAMETYDQHSENGSCLSCHSSALTQAGQDAKFSFVLRGLHIPTE